jgi:hypothetical protein
MGIAAAALGLLLLAISGSPLSAANSPITALAAQTLGTARVVQDLAPVYEGPGEGYAVVWRLYEGSQVAVGDEATGADGQTWRQVKLWNSQNGWLAAEALSFAPYPPPPTPRLGGGIAEGDGESGACRPQPEREPLVPQEMAASGKVLAATTLTAAPDDDTRVGELTPGTAVSVLGWGTDPDGAVRYRVLAGSAVGWAAPGAVALAAADPLTRRVGGRTIVEPLRGKGMWFVLDSQQHGTTPAARVAAAARANGLSHLYVEVATSRGGFWGARWLDDRRPLPHAGRPGAGWADRRRRGDAGGVERRGLRRAVAPRAG